MGNKKTQNTQKHKKTRTKQKTKKTNYELILGDRFSPLQPQRRWRRSKHGLHKVRSGGHVERVAKEIIGVAFVLLKKFKSYIVKISVP